MAEAAIKDVADSGKAAKKPGKAGGLVKALGLGAMMLVVGVAAGLGAAVGLIRFGGDLLPALGGDTHAAPAAPAQGGGGPIEYAEIDNSFTTNLVDTGRYLQLRLSVGTMAGPAVVAAVETHKPAIISAVLGVIGEASEADVANRAGKDALRARVRDAINSVLRQRGVAGAVDEVFFTSLVVQ